MNDEIYNALKNCNSEIRVQPIRYAVKGCDFMALCVIEATSDKPFEVFDDMVGGDIEYSDAETFLTSEKEKKKHGFGFSYGRDIYDAVSRAVKDAERSL